MFRLKGIDKSELIGNRDIALYSLLYSMALDKNYIDIDSDSLIAPAVNYYKRHGDKYHKFLSFYYLGRVHENASRYSEAMDSFLAAEKNMDRTTPVEYQSRLYSSKSRIYYQQFALDKMLEETIKSRDIAIGISNPQFFVRNALDIAGIYLVQGESQKAEAELSNLNRWLSDHNVAAPVGYHEALFRMALTDTTKSFEQIADFRDKYLQSCKASGTPVNHLLIARAASKTGDADEAYKAIKQCRIPGDHDEFYKVDYYSALSTISQLKGKSEEALIAERIFQETVDSINVRIFNNDIRFLEERYNKEQQLEQHKQMRTILSILIAILTIGLFSLVVVLRRRVIKYKKVISDANVEYRFINDIINEGGFGSKDVKEALSERLAALRPYLYNDKLAPSIVTARKDIEHIDTGRKELLKSVGMVYALSYPAFTKALFDYGLSAEEVGLCALYVSGYSSKEMNDFLHTGSILHINGNIRKKVGAPIEGLKIHTWLKQLFVQTQTN